MNRLIDNHQAINGPGIYLSGIPMPRGKFPLCHYLSNYQQLCGCSTRHSCWGQICENHRMWSLLAPQGWARQSIANNWRKRPVYDISQLTRSQRIGVALRLMIRNWKHGLWMRIKYDDPFTCCIRQIEIANGRFFLSFFYWLPFLSPLYILQLLDAIEDEVLQGGYLIDWHACDLFPKSWIDLVVVLRCPSTSVHYDRLSTRYFSFLTAPDIYFAFTLNIPVTRSLRKIYLTNVGFAAENILRQSCRKI